MKENNAAQAAQNAIEWATKPGAVENFPATARAHINGLASLLLSKLRAPVADERAAQRNEGFSSLSLWWTMIEAEAELAGEPIKDDAPILSFMGSGASHQVTAGDIRAALASAPVAGEAVSWQVRRTDGSPLACWETCTKELYDLTKSTGRYSGFENGPPCEVRALGVIDAAPQASAEDVIPASDVRKPGMSVAEFCAEAGRLGLTADTLAAQLSQRPEFADCLPQADKDGGQQRAGDDKEPQ